MQIAKSLYSCKLFSANTFVHRHLQGGRTEEIGFVVDDIQLVDGNCKRGAALEKSCAFLTLMPLHYISLCPSIAYCCYVNRCCKCYNFNVLQEHS